MNLSKMNKELPAGSALSHYRIVSKIGAGGMGEVYSAQDHQTRPESRNQILTFGFQNSGESNAAIHHHPRPQISDRQYRPRSLAIRLAGKAPALLNTKKAIQFLCVAPLASTFHSRQSKIAS